MNLLQQFKTARQLSKWRKQITTYQTVLVIDGKRMYKTQVAGYCHNQVKVIDPDHYGLIPVDLCCVFPVLNH